MYHFENFKFWDNNDSFRVTDHPWRLCFHTSTKIKESDVPISASEYNFVSIKDLASRSAFNLGLIGIVRIMLL